MVPRGWGGLNLFVFLPQKRQKEKTPHVDVGATQQPPVCVYRSACLGVVLCGHGDNVFLSLPWTKVIPSVNVSVCLGVWVCTHVSCTSVNVFPLHLSVRFYQCV